MGEDEFKVLSDPFVFISRFRRSEKKSKELPVGRGEGTKLYPSISHVTQALFVGPAVSFRYFPQMGLANRMVAHARVAVNVVQRWERDLQRNIKVIAVLKSDEFFAAFGPYTTASWGIAGRLANKHFYVHFAFTFDRQLVNSSAYVVFVCIVFVVDVCLHS